MQSLTQASTSAAATSDWTGEVVLDRGRWEEVMGSRIFGSTRAPFAAGADEGSISARARDRREPEERIRLALNLGDDCVETYRESAGITRHEAIARLRSARQRGRTPCSFFCEPG